MAGVRWSRLLLALSAGLVLFAANIAPHSRAQPEPSSGTPESMPVTTYDLTPLQAQQIATVMNFIDAHNAGDLEAALTYLDPTQGIIADCDFEAGRQVEARGADSQRALLATQHAVRDQWAVEHLYNHNPTVTGFDVVGLDYIRFSDTIAQRGYPQGLSKGIKIILSEDGRRIVLISNASNRPGYCELPDPLSGD